MAPIGEHIEINLLFTVISKLDMCFLSTSNHSRQQARCLRKGEHKQFDRTSIENMITVVAHVDEYFPDL